MNKEKTSKIDFLNREPEGKVSGDFNLGEAEKARSFHKTVPGFAETPLIRLEALSRFLGVSAIFVKDESSRFGLNSFKGLGGSYCLSQVIAEECREEGAVPLCKLKAKLKSLGRSDITFITATDGNHGRGIAWASRELGVKSVILMPKGSSEERLQNIRQLGAEAFRTDSNYDRTVLIAKGLAEENGWHFVQDSALPGYEETARKIMKGYLTIGAELAEQLGSIRPTHVFLQAGVGSLAGAMCGFLASIYPQLPVITIVEPKTADCIYQTACANDGLLHSSKGNLETIMAGLSCGEPCSLGWEEIKATATHFLKIDESVAATGVRVLSAPLPTDTRILAGESGASAFGAAFEVLLNKEQYSELLSSLNLNNESVLLFINSEGVTDKESFLNIVWKGSYPSQAI